MIFRLRKATSCHPMLPHSTTSAPSRKNYSMLVRFEIIDLYPATLIRGKPLFYENELYSEEHKRKITTERAGFQVVKDPKDRSKLALAINGQPIGEWFKEQFDRLFSSIRRTIIPPREDKEIRL